MQLRNPTFEVRPSVITGDTADVYLHRTQRILRSEGLNPTVSMQFSASREAVLSGSLEVKALIGKVTSEGNRELWAVEEGSHVSQNEVCSGDQGPLLVLRVCTRPPSAGSSRTRPAGRPPHGTL